MKKALAILGILALLGGCLAACGAKKPQNLLAGKWKANLAALEFQAFEFVPGADDSLKGAVYLSLLSPGLISGTYEVTPGAGKDARDMIKITYTLWMVSINNSYYFTVDGNSLTLQKEGTDVTTTYTRDTGPAAATTG